MLTLLPDGEKLAARTKDTEANLKQLVRRMETAVSENYPEKLSFYEQYSDGKISREEYIEVRDRLAAEEDRAKAEKASLRTACSTLEQTERSYGSSLLMKLMKHWMLPHLPTNASVLY